jgi:predicted lipid-binding transport protein (Tim44 family)
MIRLRTIKPLWPVLLASILAIILSFPSSSWARLGGGHSFSSGSSGGSGYSGSSSGGYSSSGGRGGSFGSATLPLAIIAVILMIAREKKKDDYKLLRKEDLLSGSDGLTNKEIKKQQAISEKLNDLYTVDPNFSKVLFLDFSRLLFTRYIQAQGKENSSPQILKHFLSHWLYKEITDKRNNKSETTVKKVDNVIIGKMNIDNIDETSEWIQIKVAFFCNYDEYTGEKSQGRTVVANYSAYFNRNKDVLSAGPEEMRSLHCPSCGSPLSDDESGDCASCGKTREPGTAQWQLLEIECDYKSIVPMEEHTPPIEGSFQGISIDLPSGTAVYESSNEGSLKNLPAGLKNPMTGAKFRELRGRDPEFSLDNFKRTVNDLFFKLQKAWSGPNFEESRPIQTESLYLTNLFWINSYLKKGQKNILADPAILSIQIVDVDCDAYYDSIKVFISATGKDYTVDKTGKVVSGNKEKSSEFTELWTLVRSVPGDDSKRKLTTCSNCAASLESASSSECPYCGSILRGSKFPWILAFIEQLN